MVLRALVPRGDWSWSDNVVKEDFVDMGCEEAEDKCLPPADGTRRGIGGGGRFELDLLHVNSLADFTCGALACAPSGVDD